MSPNTHFWKDKALSELSDSEWETLCDGCGKCCLHKLQDEDTEELLFTSIACRHLDSDTCRCTVYENRLKHVPDCVDLSPKHLEQVQWLPSTCAYRLIYEGKPLPSWHPLVSNDPQIIHFQHMSVRNKTISEDDVDDSMWDDYVIDDLN